MTFERNDFERLVDMRAWSIHAQKRLATGVVQADAWRVERLRRDLLSILASPAREPRDAIVAAPIVFESLGGLFDDAAGARQALGSASASFIVAESHRIVAASGNAPPSIDALCARLRTSRRSLQNSFKQVADTTPVYYLRSLRLNAVRRRLMSTTPLELSVAQAATDQGFSHLSHFTERYKALFGELPSQTARRRHTRPPPPHSGGGNA